MLEKKNSFKSHFSQYYTITAKNIYDMFLNKDGVFSIEDLKTRIDEMNPILESQGAFAYIADVVRFSFPCASESCKSVLGYSVAEWTKKGLSFFIDIFCYADVESNEKIFKEIIAHQDSLPVAQKSDYIYSNTFRLYHKDGYFVWVCCHLIFCCHDADGKLLYTMNIINAIDQFKSDDSCSLQIFKLNKQTGCHEIEKTYKYPAYGLNRLHDKEIDILRLLSEGFDNAEIANIIGLTESTVKTYRKTLLKKTWCSNTVELLYYAVRNGLIET